MYTQHKEFAHLTQAERFRIETLRDEKYTLREIAYTIHRNVSVISREVKRNKRSDGEYCASIAQKKKDKRRT